MNEKFIKVEILIDTTNPEQLAALSTLMTKVGEQASKTADAISELREKFSSLADNLKERIAKIDDASKPAQAKKRNTKPAEPAPAPEAPAEEETKPAEEETKPGAPAESPAEKKEYKIEEVREKLKEKVNDHREAIKAKLTELGAPNVSSLDPDNYADFMDFLNGLE